LKNGRSSSNQLRLRRNSLKSDHQKIVVTGLDPVISGSFEQMAGSSPAMTNGEKRSI